jgi:uncharacterized protein (TIGR03067 family)
MWVRLTCWLVAATASWISSPALCSNDPGKDELKKHQGIWLVTSSFYDGLEAQAAVTASIKRIVDGDHVVWERDGKRFAGSKIVLDPGSEPKAIDVIPDGGPNRGERVLGIYKLDNGTLTICMAAPRWPRPEEWKVEKGSECTLRTFRREPQQVKVLNQKAETSYRLYEASIHRPAS